MSKFNTYECMDHIAQTMEIAGWEGRVVVDVTEVLYAIHEFWPHVRLPVDFESRITLVKSIKVQAVEDAQRATSGTAGVPSLRGDEGP